jgi:hypothetical protein
VESSFERGNEPSVSINSDGNYRMAAQLVASRVVLSSTELVSSCLDSELQNFNVIHFCPKHCGMLANVISATYDLVP